MGVGAERGKVPGSVGVWALLAPESGCWLSGKNVGYRAWWLGLLYSIRVETGLGFLIRVRLFVLLEESWKNLLTRQGWAEEKW